MKIVVISALSRVELDKALAKGADAVLEKPLNDGLLVDAVTRLAK